MRTPVNSIEIPTRFVPLCTAWHGGQDCMLYAVCSTGNLTTGTHCPIGCETDEKWYLHLWRSLAANVWQCIKGCGNQGADFRQLSEFEEWVTHIVTRLEGEYDLADWSE